MLGFSFFFFPPVLRLVGLKNVREICAIVSIHIFSCENGMRKREWGSKYIKEEKGDSSFSLQTVLVLV